MTAKEILLKIKAAFDGTAPAPVPPVVPVAPAALATPMAKTYKLQDGVTDITINQAGEIPAIGDTVMIGGLPAPANTYTLQDGATIVVDAAGVITAYTAMVAPAPPPAPAPPAPAQPITLSAEEFAAMVAKFAVGSTEERMGNMEVMLKALMECNFGYEIRKGQEAAAIEAYKESLAPLQTSIGEMAIQLKAASDTIKEQKTTIAKYGETIKGLFELCEALTELPTTDPVTLTGTKKEKFENQNKKEDRIAKMADAVKAMKAESKKQ